LLVVKVELDDTREVEYLPGEKTKSDFPAQGSGERGGRVLQGKPTSFRGDGKPEETELIGGRRKNSNDYNRYWIVQGRE